jgi:hypothetical protein
MIQQLLMRGNRSLGAALLQHGLITNEELEEANQLFLEGMTEGAGIDNSLLKSLLFQVQAMTETEFLEYQITQLPVEYLPLHNYYMKPTWLTEDDLLLALATRTLPVDFIDGTIFFASAYYMSAPVTHVWEDKYKGIPVWFVCELEAIENTIYKLTEQIAPQVATA